MEPQTVSAQRHVSKFLRGITQRRSVTGVESIRYLIVKDALKMILYKEFAEMKHKASIDLEFTNGDLFEQEVIKAMRAYAKTIAREAFQDEIQECVVDTAKAWAKHLYESRYSEPMTDKLVKAEVQSYIKEQM